LAFSEEENRVFSTDPIIYPDHQRTRTTIERVSKELEHLIIQYDKLGFDQFDTPPNKEFMESLPEISNEPSFDKPFVKRKLVHLEGSQDFELLC
jgi:hypothetical protein